MTLIDLFRKYWFVKVVLALWLVSSVFLVLLLGRIDSIVNGDLYNSGALARHLTRDLSEKQLVDKGAGKENCCLTQSSSSTF